jgi:hypothetical protein
MQFVDGYVKVYHNDAFMFPIGANGKFRPVAISGAARTSAAYYDSNPHFIEEKATINLEPLIQDISNVEYWDIDGNNATKLTLTWDARSEIENLTDGDLNRLTMVGRRNNQWEVIPSSIDRFTLDNKSSDAKIGSAIADLAHGSISSTEAIRPGDYEFITLAALNTDLMARVQPQFDVYPNPQILRLDLSVNYQFASNKGGFIRLYSPNNVLLLEKEIENDRGIMRLPNVANKAGAYVVGIIDRNGHANYQKLIVVEE